MVLIIFVVHTVSFQNFLFKITRMNMCKTVNRYDMTHQIS